MVSQADLSKKKHPISKKAGAKRAAGVAQVVECLSSKKKP
jgi:hypothetical protein